MPILIAPVASDQQPGQPPQQQGSVMDTVVARLADRALGGGNEQSIILDAAERGVERGVDIAKPVVEQLRIIQAAEQARTQREIEMLRERSKEDRDRDTEFWKHVSDERQHVADERSKDRESFFKNMMEAEKARLDEHKQFQDKMLGLQKEQMSIAKEAADNQMKLQREMLEMDRRHWEEIKTIQGSQRPLEAIIKIAGEAINKFGDKLEILAKPNVAGGLAGPAKPVPANHQLPGPPATTPGAPADSPAQPTANGEQPADGAANGAAPAAPEQPLTKEQAIEMLKTAKDEDILASVKMGEFFPQVASNISNAIFFNMKPPAFMTRLVKIVEADPELPFVIRAMSRMADPMVFFAPPHAALPPGTTEVIDTDKGKVWVKELQVLLAEWVKSHEALFKV